MGWALATEGLTPKRISESEINGLLTAERGRSNAGRQKRARQKSVATRGKSGTEEEVAVATPEGVPKSGSAEEVP